MNLASTNQANLIRWYLYKRKYEGHLAYKFRESKDTYK